MEKWIYGNTKWSFLISTVIVQQTSYRKMFSKILKSILILNFIFFKEILTDLCSVEKHFWFQESPKMNMFVLSLNQQSAFFYERTHFFYWTVNYKVWSSDNRNNESNREKKRFFSFTFNWSFFGIALLMINPIK